MSINQYLKVLKSGGGNKAWWSSSKGADYLVKLKFFGCGNQKPLVDNESGLSMHFLAMIRMDKFYCMSWQKVSLIIWIVSYEEGEEGVANLDHPRELYKHKQYWVNV